MIDDIDKDSDVQVAGIFTPSEEIAASLKNASQASGRITKTVLHPSISENICEVLDKAECVPRNAFTSSVCMRPEQVLRGQRVRFDKIYREDIARVMFISGCSSGNILVWKRKLATST